MISVSVASFIQWCQHLPLSESIRSAPWPFPLIEIFHIAGFVIVFGSILVLNLRLFGLILRDEPASQVAADLRPWTIRGLGVQILTGPLLFITSAMKFYESTPFRMKIGLLIVALVYQFGIHNRLAISGQAGKGSAAISMTLWVGVIVSGLAIELLSD